MTLLLEIRVTQELKWWSVEELGGGGGVEMINRRSCQNYSGKEG